MTTGLRRELTWELNAETMGMVAGLGQASRALDDLADEARTTDAALRSIKDTVDVAVDVDAKGLQGLRDDLQEVSDVRVDVEVNESSLGVLRRRLESEKAELLRRIGDISIDIDAGAAMKQLQTLERQLKQIDGMDARATATVDVDNDKLGMATRQATTLADQFGQLGRFMSGAGPIGMAALGTAAGALAWDIAALTGPGAIGGLLGALGVGGAIGLIQAYDQLNNKTTKIGDAFRQLKKEAKQTRDDIIQVTGGILEDVLLQLDVKKSVSNAFEGVSDWVQNNGATLKVFFIQLGKTVAASIKTFTVFAREILPGLGDAVVNLVTAIMDGFSGTLNNIAAFERGLGSFLQTTGEVVRLIPGMEDFGNTLVDAGRKASAHAEDMQKYANSSNKMTQELRRSWDQFRDNILPAITDGLENAGKEMDKWWRNLDRQGKDQTLTLQVALEQGDKRAVEDALNNLSKKRITEILSKTDPNSKNDAERQLHRLARQRLAEIRAENRNDNNVENRLDRVAKDRRAVIEAVERQGDAVGRFLDRTANPGGNGRNAPIFANARDVATADNQLNNAAKDRKASVFAVANGVQDVINAIQAAAGRKYTATIDVYRNVHTSGSATAKAASLPTPTPTTRTAPTSITVEVDGYKVARQVQRRFTASGRVYV